MDKSSQQLQVFLLPADLRIQLPSLATRRFVRHQRRLQTKPQHPLELDSPVDSRRRSALDIPKTTTSSSTQTRRRRDFSYLAPTGRLVAFLRPTLLPRALAFELPPGYESCPPQSPQESPEGSCLAASPAVGCPKSPILDIPSPAPTEVSLPSYSDITSGPPLDDGYENFVQPGLENEVYDDAVNFAATTNLFYKTAPWTSDPETDPCWSENCPLWPMPHNLGLYFHYGKRPSEVLQDRLQEYGFPTIFEGGNPPEAIWECFIDEYYGNGSAKSRSMLLPYRCYHCNSTVHSRDVEDVLLAERGEARATRLRREAGEARREEQEQGRAADISLETSEDGSSQVEAGTGNDEIARSDENPYENEPGIHPANTSTGGVECGRGTYLDFSTREVTELTYWSLIPPQNTTFRRYRLLPPPKEPVFDGMDLGHQNRKSSGRPPQPSLSPMMRTFLEDIGLVGIWGTSTPGFIIFHALIRLVQHASPTEAADIRLVDRYRLENVYEFRPVVAKDSASVVSEELWLDLRRRV